MRKDNKILIIILILFILFVFTGCNKEEYIEVESIKIKIPSLEVNLPTQLEVEIYPENATNQKVDWYLYNSRNITLTEDGIITLLSIDVRGQIECIANNGVSASKWVNIIVESDFDWSKMNITSDDKIEDNILKFAEKYNNILICGHDLLNQIKERESSNNDFLEIISSLEENYFAEDKLSNYVTIILKAPETRNLKYFLDISTFNNYFKAEYEVTNNGINFCKGYNYNNQTYIIVQYELSEYDANIISKNFCDLDSLIYQEYIDYSTIYYSNIGGYTND